MSRSTELVAFYAATSAMLGCITADSFAEAANDRLIAALSDYTGKIHSAPARVDACDYLLAAFAETGHGPSAVAKLARTLRKLSPQLRWQPFRCESAGEPFTSGHAEAIIAGPEGLEQREDVMVGASLLVPGVAYPVHGHAPEELYLVLTAGDWYSEDRGWYTPNIGDMIYHRPWLKHAVRSGTVPLLTVWCLFAR